MGDMNSRNLKHKTEKFDHGTSRRCARERCTPLCGSRALLSNTNIQTHSFENAMSLTCEYDSGSEGESVSISGFCFQSYTAITCLVGESVKNDHALILIVFRDRSKISMLYSSWMSRSIHLQQSRSTFGRNELDPSEDREVNRPVDQSINWAPIYASQFITLALKQRAIIFK